MPVTCPKWKKHLPVIPYLLNPRNQTVPSRLPFTWACTTRQALCLGLCTHYFIQSSEQPVQVGRYHSSHFKHQKLTLAWLVSLSWSQWSSLALTWPNTKFGPGITSGPWQVLLQKNTENGVKVKRVETEVITKSVNLSHFTAFIVGFIVAANLLLDHINAPCCCLFIYKAITP